MGKCAGEEGTADQRTSEEVGRWMCWDRGLEAVIWTMFAVFVRGIYFVFPTTSHWRSDRIKFCVFRQVWLSSWLGQFGACGFMLSKDVARTLHHDDSACWVVFCFLLSRGFGCLVLKACLYDALARNGD